MPPLEIDSPDDERRSALFRKNEALSASFDESAFPGRYAWIDTLEDARLLRAIMKLNKKDLEYYLRCNPVNRGYQAYLTCFDLREQRIDGNYQPLVGQIWFYGGEHLQYRTAEEYLECIREELPYRATNGFWFQTISREPAVRKAVDDIVLDLYGEGNPCWEEDYELNPSEEMQMGGM